MKNSELVSIVIPCYNQAQYLEEAVRSALEQTYPDIEIIIVNDGSPDDTEAVAQHLRAKHPNKIKVITQENAGVSEARNSGIVQASGDFILPLDADDIIAKEMVDTCLHVLKETQADVVCTDVQCFGLNDDKHQKNTQHILYDNPPSPSSLFRRRVWKAVGGFKKNMSDGFEDWEFWVNVFKHDFKFQYIPETLFYYRIKEDSLYVSAKQKDLYLNAKLVANNPELYTPSRVDSAVRTIKETEDLADFFFYSDRVSQHEEMLIRAIGPLVDTTLEEQVFEFPGQRIVLFSLDKLEDTAQNPSLYARTEVDRVLWYAPLRYEVDGLQTLPFTWSRTSGFQELRGTVFPYIPRTTEEKLALQPIACERLQQYTDYLQDDLKKRREWLKHLSTMLDKDAQYQMIQEKDAVIKERGKLYDVLAQKDAVIKERGKLYDVLAQKDKELANRKISLGEKTELLIGLKKLVDDIKAVNMFFRPFKIARACRKVRDLLDKYKEQNEHL